MANDHLSLTVWRSETPRRHFGEIYEIRELIEGLKRHNPA